MAKDELISIDLRTFDKSIDNIIRQLDKLEKDVDSEIEKLVFSASQIIVNEAKTNHPWVSRHGVSGLQGSIKAITRKIIRDVLTVEVGSWKDYAYAIETGTHHENGKAFPFLLPALETKFDEVLDFVVVGLRNILNSARV